MNKKGIKNINLKAGFWYTVASFFSKGFTFLVTPIIIRMISQSDFGMYSNFNSWLSILMILSTGYLYNSIMNAQFDYKNDLGKYISNITILSSVIVIPFIIFTLLFKNSISGIIGFDFKYLELMFICLLVDGALQNYIVINRINYKYRNVTIISVLITIVPIIFGIAGIVLSENKLDGLIIGRMIPTFIISFTIYVFLLIKYGIEIDYSMIKYALFISIPFIPHALSNILLFTSDRIIIQNLCGSNDVAIYSVIYTCSMIVSLLYNSLSQAWSPWLFKALENKEYDIIKKNSKIYFLFFISLATAGMLIGPELLLIIGGNHYFVYSRLIPPIMSGIVLQYYYSYFVNIEYYYKQTFQISLNTVIAATINIFLNYILIPKYGFEVAAYTTLFGYSCLLLLHYLNARKLQAAVAYDNKWNLTLVSIYLTMMILCIKFLYELTLLRYILMLLILATSGIYIFKEFFRKEYL